MASPLDDLRRQDYIRPDFRGERSKAHVLGCPEGGGADASVRSVSRPRVVSPPRHRRRGPSSALAAPAPCSRIPTPTEGPMDTTTTGAATHVRWWKEPTKDQWMAWWAAWLGWTLDAFDFTVFLLIMVPISKEFDVPLTDVALVFTLTLWMRLVGAVASGWVADRVGRKLPLMISILGYSFCNFIAGFSPTFWFLLMFRALLGGFMGAEWPAGAALSMETWPQRSRGFMGGILQGSWGVGFLMSSAMYALFYNSIGWRGMLWIGVLPALSVFYVRYFVKEPPVWVENRRLQRVEQREVRTPFFNIFKREI